MRKRRELGGMLFLLPGFIFIFLFMIFPVFRSLYLSFSEYNFAFDPQPVFVGLDNYRNVFSDRYFLASFKNTVVFSLLFFPSIMLLALTIALLLNRELRGTGFFRTSVFLPVVVPISLSGIVFQWILNDNFGLMNFVLREVLPLGFLTQDWLADPNWAMLSIVGVSLWKFLGIEVILFLAGLQAIPKDLYEAAKVDGANSWQSLVHITLPNLKETYIITGIWAIIVSVKVFELPFIMTQGGPGTSTLVLYQYMWNTAFIFYDMGYASAIGFIMGIIILLLAFLNLRINKES
ncbi:MAG: sugar ABC transporter permease [Spirochaetae bacterium HGW-Spirochaetae-8]|nr:MAG: sugar ABC transporter permease [Spirochaetae bacterium HGW-Spirochaetae-8]